MCPSSLLLCTKEEIKGISPSGIFHPLPGAARQKINLPTPVAGQTRLYQSIPVIPHLPFSKVKRGKTLSIATNATSVILSEDLHLLPYRFLTGKGIGFAIYVPFTIGAN